MGHATTAKLKKRENFIQQPSHQDHISQRRPAVAIHVGASNSRHFHDDCTNDSSLLRARQWKVHVMQNSEDSAICVIKTPRKFSFLYLGPLTIIYGQVVTRSLPLHTCNYSQAMTRSLQSLSSPACMSVNGTVSGEGRTHGTMIVMTYREHS